MIEGRILGIGEPGPDSPDDTGIRISGKILRLGGHSLDCPGVAKVKFMFKLMRTFLGFYRHSPDSPDRAKVGFMSVLTGLPGKDKIFLTGPRWGPCQY